VPVVQIFIEDVAEVVSETRGSYFSIIQLQLDKEFKLSSSRTALEF
jgi:hypothetical protein